MEVAHRWRSTVPALVVSLLALGAAQAQPMLGGPWLSSSVGFQGGNVSALAADPGNVQRVLATTSQGVFRSEDGGLTWSPSSTGLPKFEDFLDSLVPVRDGTFLLATAAEIYRSNDGGLTWTSVFDLLPITALAVDPSTPERVLAVGLSGPLIGGEEVYESTDGGSTWRFFSVVPAQEPEESIRSVAFLADGTVLAAARDSGLYRSTDGGRGWSRITDHFCAGATTVIADPADPLVAFAVGSQGREPSGECPNIFADDGRKRTCGLFRSQDGGTTWLRQLPFADSTCDSLSIPFPMDIDPSDGNRIVTSRSRSDDGGDSFVANNLTCPGTLFASTTAILLRPGADALAGGRPCGIQRSADAGTWTRSDTGLRDSLARVVSNGIRLFAESDGQGLLRSDDDGRSWSPIPDLPTPGFWDNVTPAPSDPRVLYVDYLDFNQFPLCRFFTSIDGGDSWQLIAEECVSKLAVSFGDPQRFATSRFNSVSLRQGDDVLASASVEGFFIDDLYFDPADDDVIYVAADDPIEFLRFSNGLQTVEALTLPSADPVVAISLHPTGGRLLAGTREDGLYRSEDAGASWIRAPEIEGRVRDIQFDPADARRVLASGQNVYLSRDGGVTWQRIGGETPFSVTGTFAPGDRGRVLSGTNQGIFRNFVELNAELGRGNAGDNLGSAVASLGGLAAVGTPGRSGGAVDLYRIDGRMFVPQATLDAPAGVAGFGRVLALGERRLAVGADGAVVLYDRTNEMLAFDATLRPAGKGATTFGRSVAVDRDFVAIGATTGAGSVNVYRFPLGGPDTLQALEPADASPGDEFGYALALDGSLLAVGAPGTDNDRGAVYFFEADGGSFQHLRTTHGEQEGDRFGESLALTGALAIVGAPGFAGEQGAVFLSSGGDGVGTLESGQPVAGARFGAALALAGGRLIVGEPGAGAAYAYAQGGGTFAPTGRFIGMAYDAGFGHAVATSNGHLIVGAPDSAQGAGRAEAVTVPEVTFQDGFDR